MLYAAIDYWKYRNRRDKYSPQAMEDNGYLLAIESNFQEYKNIPLGHIAFVSTSGSIASWAIMYSGNGVASHVANFYGDGVLHDTITSGVQRREFSEYFDGISYISILPPPPGTDLTYAKKFMDFSLGAPYNWLGIIRLGLAKILGNGYGTPWYICADIFLILGIISWLKWLITGSVSTTFGTILVAYPILFAINKYRNRNWLKKVSLKFKARAEQ